MLEKMIPTTTIKIRGSRDKMSVGENSDQAVLRPNRMNTGSPGSRRERVLGRIEEDQLLLLSVGLVVLQGKQGETGHRERE